MQIDISTLPPSVLKQIPLSIKSYKNIYILEDLPSPVRRVIEVYLKTDRSVYYNISFDIAPTISEYGDFKVFGDVETTVLNYLSNYFLTLPGEYPFDPYFGCKLKLYLQTKDTAFRQSLITTEAHSVANVISSDFGVKVSIVDIIIDSVDRNGGVDYNIIIDVKINNKTKKIALVTQI